MINREYLSLTIPIVLQQMLTIAISFIDVIMISHLGYAYIAAAGICQQIYFIFYLLAGGIASGMSVFIAQYWGQRNFKAIKSVLGLSLFIIIVSFIIFAPILALSAKFLIVLISGGADEYVVNLGVSYLRIMVFSYLFGAISQCYSFAFRSIGCPRPVLIITVGAVSLKILLNYILIFGKLSIPALGLVGAGIALLITRIFELAAIIVWIYHYNEVLAANFHDLINFSRSLFVKVMSISLPVVLNDVMFAIGMLFYVSAYNRINPYAFAAISVAGTIHNIFVTVLIGLASASAVMIGNQIGAEQYELAIKESKNYLLFSLIIAVVLGLLMIIGQSFFVKIFAVEDILVAMVKDLLIIYGCCLPLRAASIMLTMGILRGGGDTRFAFFAESSTIWVIGIPVVLISSIFLHWPVHIVVLITYLEQVVKILLCLWRFFRLKWLHNVIEAAN